MSRRTITVSITQEQDDLIRACISSGRFASASEVVRAAMRLLDREEMPRQAVSSLRSAGGSASRG